MWSRSSTRALGRWLTAARVQGERAQDAMLIATELVTNGVLHDGGDQIAFRAWRGRDGLSIEVQHRRPSSAAAVERTGDRAA